MNSIIRYSPTGEMRRLQRELDRVFDTFYGGRNGDGGETEQALWAPRVDLAESEDAYLIHLDVPGMQKDELDINYHDGTLTVSGERKAAHEHTDEDRQFVRIERSYGRFFRSFSLPKAVETESISASYTDGVLTITVPKAEESKPRRIEVS